MIGRLKRLAGAASAMSATANTQARSAVRAFAELEKELASIRGIARSADAEGAVAYVRSAVQGEIELAQARPWLPVPEVEIARFMFRRLSEGRELDDANQAVRQWLDAVGMLRANALAMADTTSWETWTSFAEALMPRPGGARR
jgi:hypothetical protein